MDRIDPLYYAHSSRIDLKDETRIKATSEEALEWERQNKGPNGVSIMPCLTNVTSYPISPSSEFHL